VHCARQIDLRLLTEVVRISTCEELRARRRAEFEHGVVVQPHTGQGQRVDVWRLDRIDLTGQRPTLVTQVVPAQVWPDSRRAACMPQQQLEGAQTERGAIIVSVPSTTLKKMCGLAVLQVV
jgi:hypothetical protein